MTLPVSWASCHVDAFNLIYFIYLPQLHATTLESKSQGANLDNFSSFLACLGHLKMTTTTTRHVF